MERDFHNVSTPSDRAPIVGCKGIKRVISSDLKGDNLIDAREKKDTGSMGLPVSEEPSSTVWTNEKHRLYLNSMEASFVNQLYNHEQLSKNFFNSCGQFKVLRDGCWQNFYLERSIRDQSRVILANRWIQHFRPAHKSNDDLNPLYKEGKDGWGIKRIRSRRRKSPSYEFEACSEQLSSNAEVSDQNFVSVDQEEDKESRLCREKRMKMAAAHDSNKYKVVPSASS